MSRIIALTGAPGCGKTTTAIQLAREHEKQGEAVILVFCDSSAPPKEYLCPADDATSLGKLLTAIELNDKAILQGVTAISSHMGIMGYNPGETAQSFPSLTRPGVSQFFKQLSLVATTIILDIDASEPIFALAFEHTDLIMSVLGANVKSAAWEKHVPKLYARKRHSLLNNVQRGQPTDMLPCDSGIYLPHCNEAAAGLESGTLFHPIQDKKYQKGIQQLYHATAINKKDVHMKR